MRSTIGHDSTQQEISPFSVGLSWTLLAASPWAPEFYLLSELAAPTPHSSPETDNATIHHLTSKGFLRVGLTIFGVIIHSIICGVVELDRLTRNKMKNEKAKMYNNVYCVYFEDPKRRKCSHTCIMHHALISLKEIYCCVLVLHALISTLCIELNPSLKKDLSVAYQYSMHI